SLSSLTFVFTQRAGFPVYQTWFASVARTIAGTVSDVSTGGGSCPIAQASLTLIGPNGNQLATTRPDASGAYSFGQYATQAGYTVRVDRPAFVRGRRAGRAHGEHRRDRCNRRLQPAPGDPAIGLGRRHHHRRLPGGRGP